MAVVEVGGGDDGISKLLLVPISKTMEERFLQGKSLGQVILDVAPDHTNSAPFCLKQSFRSWVLPV